MGIYAVKEVFGSFQGEGYHAGRPCVFVRFAGCNVWDGKEENRAEAARERGSCALYCDTDFIGTDGHNGGRYKGVNALVGVARYEWDRCAMAILAHCHGTATRIAVSPRHGTATRIAVSPRKYVVFTGGEPTLQLDAELIDAFKRDGWETAIETNGSNHLPSGLDWITLSPKPPKRVVLTQASEVKCLYPDVVRNPSLTWRNQRVIERSGFRPLPVIHSNASVETVEQFVEEYDTFAVGGLVGSGRDSAHYEEFLAGVFDKATTRHGIPTIHGFGVASYPIMRRFPFSSVDSSSWMAGARWGRFRLFDPRACTHIEVDMRACGGAT